MMFHNMVAAVLIWLKTTNWWRDSRIVIKETSMMSVMLWNQLQSVLISLKRITIVWRLLIAAEKCLYLLFFFLASSFKVTLWRTSFRTSSQTQKSKQRLIPSGERWKALPEVSQCLDLTITKWDENENIKCYFSSSLPSSCHASHATDFMEKWAGDLFRELKSFKIVMNETETILI